MTTYDEEYDFEDVIFGFGLIIFSSEWLVREINSIISDSL